MRESLHPSSTPARRRARWGPRVAHARLRTLTPDYLLALVSGVLLALSFPRYGHPAFAWVALVPLLIALTGWRGRPGRLPGQKPLHAFTLGLIAGTIYFVGTVY